MITLHVPTLPPSSNAAYFNNPHGGRTLSTVGQNYKKETVAHLARTYPRELKELLPDTPYMLYVLFRMAATENKSGKTRYKKIDVSNRLKLFEDCLKDAGGIDDSQFFIVTLQKQQAGPQGEETTAYLWNLETEPTPFLSLAGRLND